MKIWLTKRTATFIAFYAIIASIGIGTIAVILEIWNIMNEEIRNRLLLTLLAIAVGVLATAVTNFLFASAEDSENGNQPSESGHDPGIALRDAKRETRKRTDA